MELRYTKSLSLGNIILDVLSFNLAISRSANGSEVEYEKTLQLSLILNQPTIRIN